MNVPRSLAFVAFLAMVAGCMSPAPTPEPAQDRLSDHTRCDFREAGLHVDCSRAARPVEVVQKLPDAVWLCTWYQNTGGSDSTDPYIFAVFYDPQANRHAIWFNMTYEGRMEPPGIWHAALYMDNETFYSFATEGPSGYVVLPALLPSTEYEFMFARLNVTLGGMLAGGVHRIVWIREPINDPNTGHIDRSYFGAIHTVRVNGTDYLFYRGGYGDRVWEGEDYSLKVWWSTHDFGGGVFDPTPPGSRFGGAMTPYGDATFCNDRPAADPIAGVGRHPWP